MYVHVFVCFRLAENAFSKPGCRALIYESVASLAKTSELHLTEMKKAPRKSRLCFQLVGTSGFEPETPTTPR